MKIVVITDTHWGFSEKGDQMNVILLDVIEKEVPKPFILLHTGDIGNHEPEHRKAYLHLLRQKFPDLKIGGVLGNHDHWVYTKHKGWRVKDVVEDNKVYFKENGINYLPEEPIEQDGVYICGFNGWYFRDVTHESYIPHRSDPADGVKYLRSRAYEDFGRRLEDMKAAKARGLKTVLCTHMGFVQKAAELDWKSKGGELYFGASPSWENFLDDTDYLLFGHSHTKFDGLAKNEKTRVINAGSDYEHPSYVVLEI